MADDDDLTLALEITNALATLQTESRILDRSFIYRMYLEPLPPERQAQMLLLVTQLAFQYYDALIRSTGQANAVEDIHQRIGLMVATNYRLDTGD